MIEHAIDNYDNFLGIRRQVGARMYEKSVAGGKRVFFHDGVNGGTVLYHDLLDGGANWEAYGDDVAPHANKALSLQLGRGKTHDLANPATWRDYTLPSGHPHRAPAAFVTRNGDGMWVATGEWVAPAGADKRGRYKALDQNETPYNAEDPNTYWQPFPTYRITAPPGTQLIIARSWVTANEWATMPSGGVVNFQAWTYVNPAAGYAPCTPDTPGAVLIAPPSALWSYSSIDVLYDMADDLAYSPVIKTGEEAMGARMRLMFDYTAQSVDQDAREAILDGRFGQFFELTISNNNPIENTARAVFSFKVLTRGVF